MIFAEKSQLMLKYQKAKAKLVEFDVAKEDYPHFPLNSNDLSFSSTYILSRYAESVIENDYNTKSELGVYVRSVAQYFDAAVGSKDRNKYDVDFLLSGATAYFFSNNFGSSKVLLRKAFQKVDATQKTAKAFLTRLLAFLFDNYPMEYMRNEDDYSLLNNAVKVYFETGENCQNIKMLSEKYRKDVYNKDDIDEGFFGDLSLAILFLSIEQSAWRLLPNYTELPSEKWRDYLRGKNGLKMLWPAQQLIGNSNILRGMNGIVQLPTGVGKTKSIELIIRSAFVEQRVSIVVIVAPLRALCNEITTDIDDICNKNISYELNFLIGNICDMLDNDMSTEIERSKDMLNILQKKVKYGVATKTAVSICETIFNDRVLATKLTNIIGDDNISSEKLLEDIKHNKKEIFSKLEQYPAYFEDRLKFLL